MFSSVILSDSGSSNLIDTPVSVFIKIFIKMICIGQNQINIYWKSIFVLKWISLSLCLSTLDSVTIVFATGKKIALLLSNWWTMLSSVCFCLFIDLVDVSVVFITVHAGILIAFLLCFLSQNKISECL